MLSNALFAYGTLMSGQVRHHLLNSANVVSIEPAHVQGTLVHLGGYPGLLLSSDDSAAVAGELITMRTLSEQLLEMLDREEGDEYRREKVTVQRHGCATVTAWTYVFVGDASGRPLIASGDWRGA